MDKVLKPQARWRMGKKYKDGTTEWSPWTKNLICKGYAELVGGLLTQGTPDSYEHLGSPVDFSSVPIYMAVGTGMPDWDTYGYPPYTAEETSLVNEVSRVPCTVRGYLQDNATEITDPEPGASSPLTIRRPALIASWNDTALLTIADPIQIREIGLIGGPGAATEGDPLQYLINLLRFREPVSKGSANPYTMVFECDLFINYE